MDVPSHEDLLGHIEAFRERHGLSRSRFGIEAAGEQQLILTLERGGNITLQRLQRIAEYMRSKDAGADHGDDDTSDPGIPSCGNADDLPASPAEAA